MTLMGCGAVGYALGSVSFSMLFARAKGVDLRAVGSGNLGATNAGRAMGKRIGVMVYVLDMLKGFLSAWLASTWFGIEAGVMAGAAAYVGHVLPFWNRFRGGKGVATLSGAMLALQPVPTLAAGVVWYGGARLSGVVAVGSLAFGVALPVAMWVFGSHLWVRWFALLGGLFLFFTHRANLRTMKSTKEDA